MAEQKRHIDTLLVHGVVPGTGQVKPMVPAVFQTAAYQFERAEDMADVFSGRRTGHLYTRISNPTVEAVERMLTVLEGGQGAILCASGMAAISLACLSLLRSGDEIVSASGIFGGTLSLFEKTLKPLGITTVFADAGDTAGIENAISERTRLIFIETIGNPLLNVPDIKVISRIAGKYGIPLVVDNTVTTACLVKPGELGAALVVYSTTKFLAGSGTTIGGALIDCGNFDWGTGRFADFAEPRRRFGNFAYLSTARRLFRDLGFCSSPFNAYMTAVGIETVSLRMEKQCANALKLARYLEKHKKVFAVNYPGQGDNAFRELARKQFGGRFGAILTLTLKDKDECFRFINNLKLARNAANIGDTRTLVIHPASTIFTEFPEADRLKNGVTEGLVRVSAGIEDIKDIIHDFKQALEAL